MKIWISYQGVRNHIDQIGEETRNIQALRESLRRLCAQAAEAGVDPRDIRRCADLIGAVEESTRFRQQALEDLLEDMKHADVEVDRVLSELSENMASRVDVPLRP